MSQTSFNKRKPYDLTVEYRENPIGIDAAIPRFSWKLPEGTPARSACEIDAGCWNSGRVAPGESVNVEWAGPELVTGQRVSWKVRVGNELGEVSEWSEPATFTMGVMKPEDWGARWISLNPATCPEEDMGEAVKVANKIGYPIMIRPSFVLGGRGMEVIYDENMLREYVDRAVGVTPERPLLIDRFLQNALECEADALSDGENVFIPSVMEHIELAGIHSGDSACVIPPVSISDENLETILQYTRAIAQELQVTGLMNMQYAIEKGKVYVIEANPRASRTVPLVSKVCNIQMAQAATRLMLGETLSSLGLEAREIPHYGVKEAVFPFSKFPEVDPVLGPEMRSTGEVLGMASTFGLAYFKSQEAADGPLPTERGGKMLVSLSEKPDQAAHVVREFKKLGFSIVGTSGTIEWLAEHGINGETVNKIGEGRPNVLDLILNKEVSLILNTPSGRRDARADDASIRKAAIKYRVSYLTTLAAAVAAANGIRAARDTQGEVKSLQAYHSDIK